VIDREEARQRGRDYIDGEAGAAAAEALGALLEALEKARDANSDDAQEDAHKQALAARADLEAAIGVRGWRRQRIVSTAAGQPAHRPVTTAKGIESIFRRGRRDTEQRFAMGRILMDELGCILGGRPENLEAATLILAEKGYHGPQAKPGKDSGIRAPTIRQGVNPDDGASEAGRWSFYTALGYTLGAEGKRDCHPSEWKQRALLHLRAIGPKPRPGPKPSKQPTFRVGLVEAERVVAAAWAHIEDESKDRDPNDESEFQRRILFRTGWRQGTAAYRANCIDSSLKLRTK
jgi:hypothetical protein